MGKANDEDDEFDDLDDVYETIVMLDENEQEIELVIIDNKEYNGYRYLLCIESELADVEESDASILKEVNEDGGEVFYEHIANDEEFEAVAALFGSSDADYEIEL